MSLTQGKFASRAILAARAVLPAPTDPSMRAVTIGVRFPEFQLIYGNTVKRQNKVDRNPGKIRLLRRSSFEKYFDH